MVDEGTFYPIKSMKAEERLWWYSRFFDCVEVNSTFYAPLSAQNAVLWAKRTPPGFLFSVKAYALLTGHHLDAGRLPEPLAGMLPAAATADARGRIDNAVFPRRGPRLGIRHVPRGAAAARRRGQARLCPVPDGAVVPPWPRGARLSRDASRAAARRSPSPSNFGTPRGCRGHTDEVLRFLAERGLTYVSVDAPRTPANVSSDLALTSPVAVILRLHGRNVQGFMKQLRGQAPTVAEKYGYLYDSTEIDGDRRPRPRARRAGEPHLLQAEQQCRRCPRHQWHPDPGAARPGHRRPRPGGGGVATAPAPRPPRLTGAESAC